MILKVLCKESVAQLREQRLFDVLIDSQLIIFELADDFLPQLKLHIVYQVAILAKSVEQLLLIEVLFVHPLLYIYQTKDRRISD